MMMRSQKLGMYAPPAADGPNRQQICGTLPGERDLVVEDPSGAAPAREHLDLVGDAGPGGVDEPEDRQLLAQRHLRGPHDLLDRAAAPGPRLDGRVVRDDDRGPAIDRASAGHHAIGRQPRLQGVGVAAVLDERPLVEEQRDPVADIDLALRVQLRLAPSRALAPMRSRPRSAGRERQRRARRRGRRPRGSRVAKGPWAGRSLSGIRLILLHRTRSGLREAETAGDEHALDLRGALADLEDLGVSVEPRHGVLLHEAVARRTPGWRCASPTRPPRSSRAWRSLRRA